MAKLICAAVIYDNKMYVGTNHEFIWDRILAEKKNVPSNARFDERFRGYLTDAGTYQRRGKLLRDPTAPAPNAFVSRNSFDNPFATTRTISQYQNPAAVVRPADMDLSLAQTFADRFNTAHQPQRTIEQK